MELKNYIAESFTKEYAYRVKFAHDCGADQMDMLEKCLAKYNFVSASPFKRAPIQENPVEFQRAKNANFTSEVCSTDVVLKYPVNERILEVWLAVNLGVDHERVLCYGIDEPRRVEADIQAERLEDDKDRYADMDEAELNNEDQAHYEAEQNSLDAKDYGFGEEFNEAFLKELQKIKDEKGADYFSNYPSKDELMGDNLRPMYDALTGMPNMGRGAENSKAIDVVPQSGSRSR